MDEGKLLAALHDLATSSNMSQTVALDVVRQLSALKVSREVIKANKLNRLLTMVRAKATKPELVQAARALSGVWRKVPSSKTTLNPKVIKFYRQNDPYGEFSNFLKRPITLDGKVWPSTEHYFQAMKFAGTPHEEELRLTSDCAAVKKLGGNRAYPLRSDWEEVKDGIMYDCVLAKFEQHADLKKILLSTGTAVLVEHTRNDRYWADGGDGTGKNMLGVVLMQVREELASGKDASDEPAPASAAASASGSARLVEKSGDLLNATEKYLVHQTNCVTNKPKGLSAALFAKFPHANVYNKETKRTPGEITIRGAPGRMVVNLHGQVGPGKPKSSGDDSAAARLQYFKSGLAKLAKVKSLESVAIPFKIGCGLAGGDWSKYKAALEEFAQNVAPARVVLYKLDG